ncbi:hypothetical protein Hanom_Chr14g01281191 [Helianthus anomalus]
MYKSYPIKLKKFNALCAARVVFITRGTRGGGGVQHVDHAWKLAITCPPRGENHFSSPDRSIPDAPLLKPSLSGSFQTIHETSAEGRLGSYRSAGL